MKKVLTLMVLLFAVTMLIGKPLPMGKSSVQGAPATPGFFSVPDIRAFHDRIGRMLEDEFARFDSLIPDTGFVVTSGGVGNFSFQSDVYEENGYYVVKCDLPGIEKKDIKVYVDKGMLVIQGERKREVSKKDEKKHYIYQERSYGSFYRAFSLPSYVKTDSIEATFENGVLTVKIPIDKKKKPTRKYIEIK